MAVLGAKPEGQASTPLPSWADDVYRILKEAEVRLVGMVPDAGHSRLIHAFEADPESRVVTLTTEEEGVAMLGDWGEFNPWQIPMGQGTQTALEAMGVIVTRADEPDQVAPTVWGAANLAFNSWRPAAVLIGQRVLGAKNFK